MGKAKSAPTPEPVVVNTVCSLCGEGWGLHQAVDGEVTTLECIRLLRARVPNITISNPVVLPYRYPTYQPYWSTFGLTSVTNTGGTATPKVLTATVA